ncbi:hypothetical protein PVL29_018883 [Vitis rotundifolia]|uniref:CCHC-type domain-containing protein n=1 Tax=Vitis rotundifolia TaxID=103349 RepID=A0AA39DFK8_VITRO|nr:hypothetical protein PVL29_018883 [Vitis rotundifolia]
MTMAPQAELRRPKTLLDLLGGPWLTKLLLNVTIQRSLGLVQVVMSPDSTYAKEGQLLALPTTDPASFDLHYSQFNLENLANPLKKMKRYFKEKEVECFNCGCLGHVFTNCPSPEDIKKSMQVTWCDVNSNKGDSMTSKDQRYE